MSGVGVSAPLIDSVLNKEHCANIVSKRAVVCARVCLRSCMCVCKHVPSRMRAIHRHLKLLQKLQLDNSPINLFILPQSLAEALSVSSRCFRFFLPLHLFLLLLMNKMKGA